MLNLHKDHKSLVLTALLVFVLLSTFIAIVPAYQLQEAEALPNQPKLSSEALKGLKVYVGEGCVGCHTQQVRGIEMDQVWGGRPSLPSDYVYSKQRLSFWQQSASLLGSERTGPDLTNVAVRQPSDDWHYLHLYNPRAVVRASIMPAYPWLFEAKDSTAVLDEDVVMRFPDENGNLLVARPEAIHLIAYLKSLKQTSITIGTTPEFIASSEGKKTKKTSGIADLPDGEKLFMANCAACHQADGQGVKGAFPPLAGSRIVTNANPELLINIILQGYNARTEYGQMPSFAQRLTDEEIAAIANHERSSWGNNAAAISPEEVAKIREFIKMQ